MIRRFWVVVTALSLASFALGLAVGQAIAAPRSGAQATPTASLAAASSVGPGDVASRTPGRRSEAPSLAVGASPTPTVTARAQPRPTVDPTATASESGTTLTGPASWYCCTAGYGDGLFAAAGPRLRAALGHWRGRVVEVCASRCIRVRLVDFCGCPFGRVIDLERSAFAELAPLSRGVIPVRVAWS